jgi:methylenetetrahydrofolate reductase (NADPH)
VTYGAGGSTREKTLDIALQLKDRLGLVPLVHFTCVGSNREEIRHYIERVRDEGLVNILALRGDPPRGESHFTPPRDGFRYANELVSFIRSIHPFTIAVAGYPEGHIEAPDMETDIEHLKMKIDAGGEFIITQLFFDNTDFFRYMDHISREGIDKPVVPGIMPVTGLNQVNKSVELSGARIPDELQKIIEFSRDEDELRKRGLDYTIRQCQELKDNGVPGFHFYTLNRSFATGTILDALDIENHRNEGQD